MNNINGYCPHCNANLDGDLVIDYPISQGKSKEEALNILGGTSMARLIVGAEL